MKKIKARRHTENPFIGEGYRAQLLALPKVDRLRLNARGGNATTASEVKISLWGKMWLWRPGVFAACVVCGSPTRARLAKDLPVHMFCRQQGPTAREAPNRHERRRQGLARPPIPEWVRLEWPERFGGIDGVDADWAIVDEPRDVA